MAELVTLAIPEGDTLTLDSHGAYVVSLQSAEGKDVLFARTHIGEKLRGGIPVCAPIFGPGNGVGLAQHGFARNIGWDIIDSAEGTVHLQASLDEQMRQALPAEYRGLMMCLSVTLKPNRLEMTLSLHNDGDRPCVVSPAFHPYFPTQDARAVTVLCDQIKHSFTVDQLEQTQFLSAGGKPVMVQLDELEVMLESNELQHYAVWSGNPNAYICVEPSAAGNLPSKPAGHLMLVPGESRAYSMLLSWHSR